MVKSYGREKTYSEKSEPVGNKEHKEKKWKQQRFYEPIYA